jgi:hypothetical protein
MEAMMNEFLAEMVKRGNALKYDKTTLDFVVGYMHDTNRNLNLKSNRQAEPANLAEEAKWIFAQNPFVQVIIWFDDHSWFARAERARSGKVIHSGKEYTF